MLSTIVVLTQNGKQTSQKATHLVNFNVALQSRVIHESLSENDDLPTRLGPRITEAKVGQRGHRGSGGLGRRGDRVTGSGNRYRPATEGLRTVRADVVFVAAADAAVAHAVAGAVVQAEGVRNGAWRRETPVGVLGAAVLGGPEGGVAEEGGAAGLLEPVEVEAGDAGVAGVEEVGAARVDEPAEADVGDGAALVGGGRAAEEVAAVLVRRRLGPACSERDGNGGKK